VPITILYTLTATVAVFFNAWFLLRAWRRREDILHDLCLLASDRKRLRGVATGFVQIWAAILLSDLLMAVAGLGIILAGMTHTAGLHNIGYLLALVPLVSVVVAVLALRKI
jgi:hypothetical protein